MSKPDTSRRCDKCGQSTAVKEGRRWRCGPCNVDAVRRWRAENPARSREINRRYSQRRSTWLRAGDCSRSDLERIYEEASGFCEYCRALVDYPEFNPLQAVGFDHVVPRPLGGEHTAANIVVSCQPCNSRKGTRSPEEFSPGVLERVLAREGGAS